MYGPFVVNLDVGHKVGHTITWLRDVNEPGKIHYGERYAWTFSALTHKYSRISVPGELVLLEAHIRLSLP